MTMPGSLRGRNLGVSNTEKATAPIAFLLPGLEMVGLGYQIDWFKGYWETGEGLSLGVSGRVQRR